MSQPHGNTASCRPLQVLSQLAEDLHRGHVYRYCRIRRHLALLFTPLRRKTNLTSLVRNQSLARDRLGFQTWISQGIRRWWMKYTPVPYTFWTTFLHLLSIGCLPTTSGRLVPPSCDDTWVENEDFSNSQSSQAHGLTRSFLRRRPSLVVEPTAVFWVFENLDEARC